MAQKGEPGGTLRTRVRPVMHPQDTANYIFIDLHAESQGDLLGNAGAAPDPCGGIPWIIADKARYWND